jgi:glutaredoxin
MSNEKSENAISEKKNTSVAVPSVFLDDANSGLETLTADDITIPSFESTTGYEPRSNEKR